MDNKQGFSFMEVLISLLLISSTSLTLLNQQRQVNKVLHKLLFTERTSILYENSQEKGISLIELVICLFLSTLLFTVIMQHYLIAKTQHLQINSIVHEKMETNLVISLLRDKIRNAGFTPCMGISLLESRDIRSGKTAIKPIEQLKQKYAAISISRMSDSYSKIDNQLSQREFLLHSKLPLQKNQSILISDCFHAEVQEIEEVNGQYLRLKSRLHFQYFSNFYLGEWLEEQFMIGKNQQGRLALFYKKNHSEELSDSIQDFHYSSILLRNGLLTSMELIFSNHKHLILETRVRAP